MDPEEPVETASPMGMVSPTLRKMAGAKSLNRVKFKDEKEEGAKPVKVGENEALID